MDTWEEIIAIESRQLIYPAEKGSIRLYNNKYILQESWWMQWVTDKLNDMIW